MYRNVPRRDPVRDGYEGILRRHAVREAAARTYARALPIVPVRARGLTVEGADGRRYLDCASGAGALVLGHNHPVVLESIRSVLDSGAPLHAYDLATPVRDAFVTELLRTLPPGLADHARVRFCGPAGTDAVEAALQLVRDATGLTDHTGLTDRTARTEILAFAGGQRGVTTVACQASGDAVEGELCSPWAEFALDAPEFGLPNPKPAGVLLEPVQSDGGVIPVPDDWMRRIRHTTATHSIPLIVDETETGVGRTGAFWAVQHSGVIPDVMVLSKAIGGSLPLSVIVHRDDLDIHQPDAHVGEFRANQLAMAAGTATLTYVRENDLAGRAADIGARMLSQLGRSVGEFACVGDVRGRGLMIGVEFVGGEGTGTGAGSGAGAGEAEGAWAVAGMEAMTKCQGAFVDRAVESQHKPRSAPTRAAELAAAVQQECLRRGLIVELTGHHANVVRLLPPLTITDEQAGAVLDRLYDAVEAVARGQTGGSGTGSGVGGGSGRAGRADRRFD
ncbi:aminotransferase class III-fold pyridoxal phosphate-dependent enzyme [Streptomyces sp. NPDC096013]|uniref:aminotransferase class III-fold pyridoxal phosphate-dependent enzyme n=1 Tax=Streptomyces sp. NPDC096013 TaxID=3366069 RepID=UPI0038094025